MERRGFLFLTCLLSMASCGEPPVVEREAVVRPVRLLTLGAGGDAARLSLPGAIHAVRETDVAFEVGGRIAALSVDEGVLVVAGQTLASLDPRDYENARDSALASRNRARADYDRYLEASRANAVTRQDVDAAKRDLEVAQADLNTALKALEETTLKAPFAGRIADKLVNAFENIDAKQTIFVLHDESSLEVRVNVAEQDWARGSRDLTIAEVTSLLKPEVEISALPGTTYPAYAKTFATAVDPITRTYGASFGFEPPPGNSISPGMTAKLFLSPTRPEGDESSVLRVPSNAVFTPSDGKASVWQVDDGGVVQRTLVQLGPLESGELTVLGGLDPGSRIAISGIYTLVQGQRVRPLVN